MYMDVWTDLNRPWLAYRIPYREKKCTIRKWTHEGTSLNGKRDTFTPSCISERTSWKIQTSIEISTVGGFYTCIHVGYHCMCVWWWWWWDGGGGEFHHDYWNFGTTKISQITVFEMVRYLRYSLIDLEYTATQYRNTKTAEVSWHTQPTPITRNLTQISPNPI